MITIAALALTAYNLAKPFLDKTGEGVARKVGEDIWTVIKKSFQGNDESETVAQTLALTNESEFKALLEQKLAADEELRTDLEKSVQKAQVEISGNFQQNVNSYGEIDKQINIQTNSGNIQM